MNFGPYGASIELSQFPKSLTMIQIELPIQEAGHDWTPTSEALQDKSLRELSWRGSRIKNPDLCESPCIYV